MNRRRQPDPAIAHIVHRVESLKPCHTVDKVEPGPGDRTIVRHDQIVAVRFPADVCVQLFLLAGRARDAVEKNSPNEAKVARPA